MESELKKLDLQEKWLIKHRYLTNQALDKVRAEKKKLFPAKKVYTKIGKNKKQKAIDITAFCHQEEFDWFKQELFKLSDSSLKILHEHLQFLDNISKEEYKKMKRQIQNDRRVISILASSEKKWNK